MIEKIKWLFNPLLRCPKEGHKNKVVKRKIRRKSSQPRVVVDDWMADFDVCARCGHKSKPYNEVKVDWFNSCSMPNSMWDEIKKNGFVEV